MFKKYSNNSFFFFFIIAWIVCVPVLSFAQVRVEFKERTSSQILTSHQTHIKEGSNGKVYNLRGDFVMLGNSNLTSSTPATNSTSNNTTMVFVDIDDDGGTLNSSKATLELPANCTEIVYAGLYWSGRAQNSDSNSHIIDFSSSSNVRHSTNHSNYDLTISIQGSDGNSVVVYRFDIGNETFWFKFNNSEGNNAVSYSTDSTNGTNGTFSTRPGEYSSGNGNGNPGNNRERVVFNNPVTITVNGATYTINSLTRDSRNNRSLSEYQGDSSILNLSISKTIDKRKVRLRKEGDDYQEINAEVVNGQTQLYFPTNSDGYMYSAYADVTNYVRTKGAGEYSVADIATRVGNFTNDGTGLYAGWGMVVIYANPQAKWRDIMVFDGHAYVAANGGSHNIPLQGFRSAQYGDVNVTLGVMAGEGDRSVKNDQLMMVKKASLTNALQQNPNLNLSDYNGNSSSDWQQLNHALNPPTWIDNWFNGYWEHNFFNSSIYTESVVTPSQQTARTPNTSNNLGIDIAKFNLSNSDKSLIGNDANKSILRYESGGDTYVIFNVVFAVDAYIPEAEAVNLPSKIIKANNGGELTTPAAIADYMDVLQPGDRVEMKMNIYNYSSERVRKSQIDIEIPSTMKVVSANSTNQQGTTHIKPLDFTPPTTVGPANYVVVDDDISNNSNDFSSIIWLNPDNLQPTTIDGETYGGMLRWYLGTIPIQQKPLNTSPKIPLATLTYMLEVTNDCEVLKYNNETCSIKPEIDGKIWGIGEFSNTEMTPQFITGYETGCGNSPIYGSTVFNVNPGLDFLQYCNQYDGEVVQDVELKFNCASTNAGITEISKDVILFRFNEDGSLSNELRYPEGTQFYTQPPINTDYHNYQVNMSGSTVPVQLDQVNGEFVEHFYAVVPFNVTGNENSISCFYTITIKVSTISSTPTVVTPTGVKCIGEPYNFNVQLSTQGAENGLSIRYFQSQDSNTALTVIPNITTPGTYTYYVAEGTLNLDGQSWCYGPKVPLTFTLENCYMDVNPNLMNPYIKN